MIASRTTPTLCVLVIATGPSSSPLSCTQVVPVISPLPLSVNHAANTGIGVGLAARMNHRHAGAHGPLADDQLAAAGDQRRVAHLDAGHVGDRIERPGGAADRQLEIALSRLLRLQGDGKNEEWRRERRSLRACSGSSS